VIRWRPAGFVVLVWLATGLGFYELTAKSPQLTGAALPGWWATEKAEKATRWRPPTGLLPLDKMLHEGEEAARFYATLATFRPPRGSHLR
jgi:hypothetical protein